jgi:hypothetical protein
MDSAEYANRIGQWHQNAYETAKAVAGSGQTFIYLGKTLVVPPEVQPPRQYRGQVQAAPPNVLSGSYRSRALPPRAPRSRAVSTATGPALTAARLPG